MSSAWESRQRAFVTACGDVGTARERGARGQRALLRFGPELAGRRSREIESDAPLTRRTCLSRSQRAAAAWAVSEVQRGR